MNYLAWRNSVSSIKRSARLFIEFLQLWMMWLEYTWQWKLLEHSCAGVGLGVIVTLYTGLANRDIAWKLPIVYKSNCLIWFSVPSFTNQWSLISLFIIVSTKNLLKHLHFCILSVVKAKWNCCLYFHALSWLHFSWIVSYFSILAWCPKSPPPLTLNFSRNKNKWLSSRHEYMTKEGNFWWIRECPTFPKNNCYGGKWGS